MFANFVLADEINRAPAKVQSALLEAMQERQVTLAGETRALPSPFLVLATQNPVELEGTYPLPEAQLDRFLLKVVVGYPSKDEEKEIVAPHGGHDRAADRRAASPRPSRCSRRARCSTRSTSTRRCSPTSSTSCSRRARPSRRGPRRAEAADPLRRLAARLDRAHARRAGAGASSRAAAS